jgi:hypothetical protein
MQNSVTQVIEVVPVDPFGPYRIDPLSVFMEKRLGAE